MTRESVEDSPAGTCHIENRHSQEFPKALLDAVARRDYVSYFENEHGEQWFFTRERGSLSGFIYGGDLGWERAVVQDRTQQQVREHLLANGSRPGNLDTMERLVDPLVPDVILNSHERAWLNTVWETSASVDNRSTEVRTVELATQIAARADAASLAKHPNNSDYRGAMALVMVQIGIEAGRRGFSDEQTAGLVEQTLRALPHG